MLRRAKRRPTHSTLRSRAAGRCVLLRLQLPTNESQTARTKVSDRSAIVFWNGLLPVVLFPDCYLAARRACDLLNRRCGTVRRRRRRWSKLRAKWSTTCPCEVPPGLQAATEVSESLCTQRHSRPLSTVLSEALARSHRSASIEAAARARFDDDSLRGACQDTPARQFLCIDVEVARRAALGLGLGFD